MKRFRAILVLILIFAGPKSWGTGNTYEEFLKKSSAANEMEVFEEPKTLGDKPSIRKVRLKHQSKNGLYKLSKDCPLYKEPKSSSKIVGAVKGGKKIWLDNVSPTWRKAYRKSGPAFLQSSCI